MSIGNKQIGIYKITSPSGKVYIGQSWDIVNRFRKYKSVPSIKQQRFLYSSIKKHGIDAHDFEIVYILPTDIEQSTLDNYEIFYITQFKEAGYKMMNIREGGLGGKLAKESIEKMIKTRGKWNHSEETRKKISQSHKGIKHSLETIQKMTGRKLTIDHINKLKGKKRSEATIEKLKKITPPGRLVLDKEMGIFYDSIAMAARVFTINQKTLHNRLTGSSKNTTNLILV